MNGRDVLTSQLSSEGIGMTRPIASSNLIGSWNHECRVSGEGLDVCELAKKLMIFKFDCQMLLARFIKVCNCGTMSLRSRSATQQEQSPFREPTL